MIRSWLFAFLFIVSALHAFAQTPQLHITVVDTRGAAVAGARVELARPNGSIVAVESTTTEGIASFTKAAAQLGVSQSALSDGPAREPAASERRVSRCAAQIDYP